MRYYIFRTVQCTFRTGTPVMQVLHFFFQVLHFSFLPVTLPRQSPSVTPHNFKYQHCEQANLLCDAITDSLDQRFPTFFLHYSLLM